MRSQCNKQKCSTPPLKRPMIIHNHCFPNRLYLKTFNFTFITSLVMSAIFSHKRISLNLYYTSLVWNGISICFERLFVDRILHKSQWALIITMNTNRFWNWISKIISYHQQEHWLLAQRDMYSASHEVCCPLLFQDIGALSRFLSGEDVQSSHSIQLYWSRSAFGSKNL